MLLVLSKAGTKFLTEEGFLAAGLYVEGEPNNSHSQQPADCAESDGGSKKREQNSCVDRMANETIRSGPNELVSFFERDDAAPVRAEMPPRPKSHRDSRGGQENAKPFAEGPSGKEAIVEPAVMRLRLIEQIKNEHERKRISNPLKDGFALLGSLALKRGHQPIGAKEKPQCLNPLARRREIHIALQNAAGPKMKQPEWHWVEEMRNAHLRSRRRGFWKISGYRHARSMLTVLEAAE